MPQLNILISDDLMESLNKEAKRLGMKKAALVKAKLAPVDREPLAANPEPLKWSTAGHLKEKWVEAPIGPDAVKPRADVPYKNEEPVMPTPAQLSGKTGLPIATCVRLLAQKRVFVDGGHVLVDGEPV